MTDYKNQQSGSLSTGNDLKMYNWVKAALRECEKGYKVE